MKNLTAAIYGKLSGSALSAHIGTRMYKGYAPDEAAYPYIVYFVVDGYSDDTFTEKLDNITVQFSIFSDNTSSTEAEDIYADLKTLYDDTTLTVSGETVLCMIRTNTTPLTEEHTTDDGLVNVWHYAVEYMLKEIECADNIYRVVIKRHAFYYIAYQIWCYFFSVVYVDKPFFTFFATPNI